MSTSCLGNIPNEAFKIFGHPCKEYSESWVQFEVLTKKCDDEEYKLYENGDQEWYKMVNSIGK